ELKGVLAYWQEVLSFLYFIAYQLDFQERNQLRLNAVTSAIPWVAAATNDDAFLRRMVTLLTCHNGLAWHRALIFLFRDTYPADAQCVMAIGGNGDPRWAARQGLIRSEMKSIKDYMLKTEDPDYARGDDLFDMVRDPHDPFVIPSRDIVGLAPLH